MGLCFDRPDSALQGLKASERLGGLAPFGDFESFDIPQTSDRLRFAWDHFRSVVFRRPYTWYTHDVNRVKGRLRALLKDGNFDVVHMDSMDLIALLPELQEIPVVVTHHNVESLLLRRRADSATNRLVRWYLSHQARLLETAERWWLPRVALNLAVSEGDAALFRGIAPAAKLAVVPNGVDTEYFTPSSGPVDGCVFVGGTSWYPNLDALEWFVADVLPRLRVRGMQSQVTWVGRASAEELERYNRIPGFRLTGYVPDIRPFVHSAACFIAPIRVGGGTRLKLLDAWAMGKAVVSTSSGAEGLNYLDGENILIADSAELFADRVMIALTDAGRRTSLEAGARSVAEREYGWQVIGAKLRSLYFSLLKAL